MSGVVQLVPCAIFFNGEEEEEEVGDDGALGNFLKLGWPSRASIGNQPQPHVRSSATTRQELHLLVL